MKNAPKRLILFSLLLISFTTIFANNKANLVEIAKHQRVLSQKIAKSYLLLAYGANLPEIKVELKSSVFLFDNNIMILESESPTLFSKTANNIITKQSSIWKDLKVNVTITPNTSNLNQVVTLANNLLRKSHLAYIALKTESEITTNNTIDINLADLLKISEKQEILSERLCLFFVAQKINVVATEQNPKILGTLRSVVEKLERQLLILLETNINSTRARKTIDNALVAFEDIRTNKTDFLDGKPSMNTIYKTTKELNKLFNILTTEYSNLSSI